MRELTLELTQLVEMPLIQPSYYEDGDDAASVFDIALVGDDADHVVGIEQPENLTREEIEIGRISTWT